MNKQEQKIRTLQQKIKSERRLRLALLPWLKEIAATYRIGNYTIDNSIKEELPRILNKFYGSVINDILHIDIRHYKAYEDIIDTYYRNLAKYLENAKYVHNLTASSSIISTAEAWTRKVSDIAITAGWTERDARQALLNHLRNQSLTICTTETQWIVESTRTTAVLLVNDPLKDSVMQIADLISAGDNNAAVRLSRRVMNLAQQPLSLSQGQTIREVRELTSTREALMTPLTQGRIIANLRERGRSLGAARKEWSAIGDSKTRESHLAADEQRRGIEEPFQLEEGRLMYPGDASLGAKLSTIINCRCSAIFI